jgi:hypothetical protein
MLSVSAAARDRFDFVTLTCGARPGFCNCSGALKCATDVTATILATLKIAGTMTLISQLRREFRMQ